MSALAPRTDLLRVRRHLSKVPEPDVTHPCRWLVDPLNGYRCRSYWSDRATLPTAEIGCVQLFSSCHALLGSGRLYSCTTLTKNARQPRPNAANHDMLSLKYWDNVPSPYS